MSVRYRFKRSSAPVNEPIPAHPDAMYRPQNRPVPPDVPPPASSDVAARSVTNNVAVAAPLATDNGGFSPWWIIGPLLALLAVLALGTLLYMKKKKMKTTEANDDREKRTVDDQKNAEMRVPAENIPLKNMKSNVISEEQKRMPPLTSSTTGSGYSAKLIASKPVTSPAPPAPKLGQTTAKGPHKSDMNTDKRENEISPAGDLAKVLPDKSKDPNGPASFEGGRRNKDAPSSKLSDLNGHTSPGHGPRVYELNSPEQHGMGKSPLISSMPTGAKRNEKEKPLAKALSTKEVTDDKQSKTVSNPSVVDKGKPPAIQISSDQVSKSIKTVPEKLTSENATTPNEKSSKNDLGKLDQRLLPQADPPSSQRTGKSNESGRATSPLPSKSTTLLPHVPQCKTNTSSDDDDYDEFYSIPPNASTTQSTTSKRPKTGKSNSNVNAFVHRKKRTLRTHRSTTKGVHLRNKNFHPTGNDHQ